MVGFGQPLEVRKASPFTGVQWENGQPIVQFENEWYHFEKLEDFTKEELLDFCKKEFGHKWKKRFSEDLVEVLYGLGYTPSVKVRIQLSKDGVSETHTGIFTRENRQRILAYNKSAIASSAPRTLSRNLTTVTAIEDLRQFEDILESRSSYARLSTFDYKAAIRKLGASIEGKNDDINMDELANEMSKILSKIGDRHASVKNEAFHSNGHKTYRLRLPFGVKTIAGQLVAITHTAKDSSYTYYDSAYPRIKSIDGIGINTLIDTYNYKDQKAPIQAKISRGARAIQNYGALLFKNNIACPERVTVVFSNGLTEKTDVVQLTRDPIGYASKVIEANYSHRETIRNGNFDGLSKVIAPSIGYIKIPEMYHYNEVAGLEVYIERALEQLADTKALIIDVRNNPGGSREILQTFAGYLVQPEQSPWIANVAYLRTDEKILGDEESMSARYLHPYISERLTDADRNAIDQFTTNLQLQHTVDTSRFSVPFFMVLHHGTASYTQPVYILVNENSFSAATVFTSAFKGLPNVKIVGETTDGSSGNSREMYLKHSNIRVKVSTMLSFQRNGKTLDGNGTVPDSMIPADEAQVLRGRDTQLSNLIELIKGNK
jgi:hypothetical protein